MTSFEVVLRRATEVRVAQMSRPFTESKKQSVHQQNYIAECAANQTAHSPRKATATTAKGVSARQHPPPPDTTQINKEGHYWGIGSAKSATTSMDNMVSAIDPDPVLVVAYRCIDAPPRSCGLCNLPLCMPTHAAQGDEGQDKDAPFV
ncbi:hypothetical protein AMATHDRAFT_4441 [Amanita thiersii Skay4041]|uniref:Uncharacterized protein n=1 Tax=Amanita thiersii Skay4041 TaxID=703135 RepID=A0A2A9NH80_9AGAR|nr:hypothetical protein AMATHDRAFT_4441 [Amanita thiersii Skay4041]